ncbi:MAG: carboxypeptidase-like regulatory domain-containing protein [Cytophagales bacterium]|nr:carboxypeptidase-like regulatory domain-containing protein [Cytophagales bacterium]
MSRYFLLIWGVLLATQIHGQELPTVTITFQDTPLKEALGQLESRSGVRLFCELGEVDSLTVSANFNERRIDQLIDELVVPLGFQVLVHDDQLFLMLDNRIMTELPLVNAALNTGKSTEAIAQGLIFSQDYADQQAAENLEQTVMEIGQRSKMVSGERSTLVGYVREKETGDPVADAVVYVENPTTVVSTDENGFYSISLPNGRNELKIQYAGLKVTRRNIVLFSEGQLNVDMRVDVIALREVLVESDRDANFNAVKMGVTKIDVKGSKNVPIVLGERDVIKVATTYAGVQTLGEGAAGFNVRGGKSDQNLIQFNGAPIYNANHFLGFFSVFNSDVIDRLDIYKASVPAKYGGRLSSVFDIHGKPAQNEKITGRGGVSPVTSKLALEIPVIKGKSGLVLGGRSTYSNWILRQSSNANFNENRISFRDLVLQYDHKIAEGNELKISAYSSDDEFRLNSDTLFSFSNLEYRNRLGSIAWKRVVNEKFDLDLKAYGSYYQYQLTFDQSLENAFIQDFDIRDLGLTADGTYYWDDRHTIVFGTSFKHYQINPGSRVPLNDDSEVAELFLQPTQGREFVLHAEDQVEWNEKMAFSVGLRYTLFQALGAGTVNQYAENGPKNRVTRQDSVSFGEGEVIKTNGGLEYRLSARYTLSESSSLKFGLNRSRQYIHTLTNSATLSPTDTWALTGFHLKPQIADQISLGYFRNFTEQRVEASIEGYYKRLQNLVDFKVGADFLLNPTIETAILQGPGRSYGVEFSLKKKGKLNGWFNYTFSRTLLQLSSDFAEEIINEGEYFPASYDKPHSINLVANYKATRRWSFSYNLNYSTGRPVTAPVGSYDFKGQSVVHFSDRNTFRIPDYLRMDIGINLEEGHLLNRFSHAYWSFSIYNVLGRDNPYSVFFDSREGEVEAFKLVVFGDPIPTLSFNFRF